MGMWLESSSRPAWGHSETLFQRKGKKPLSSTLPKTRTFSLLSPSEESYCLKKRGLDPCLSFTFNTREAAAPDPFLSSSVDNENQEE